MGHFETQTQIGNGIIFFWHICCLCPVHACQHAPKICPAPLGPPPAPGALSSAGRRRVRRGGSLLRSGGWHGGLLPNRRCGVAPSEQKRKPNDLPRHLFTSCRKQGKRCCCLPPRRREVEAARGSCSARRDVPSLRWPCGAGSRHAIKPAASPPGWLALAGC